MSEKPILFNTAMVRAILNGSKSQTRRVAAKDPYMHNPPRCPFGTVGGRLWVREAWAYNPDLPGVAGRACFMADPEHRHEGLNWKPSIHMPRAVCRITLEVTGVRVERLQAISYDDALAEGIMDPAQAAGFPAGIGSGETVEQYARRTHWPQRTYQALWESIHGPTSWTANPLVWVVAFKRVKP